MRTRPLLSGLLWRIAGWTVGILLLLALLYSAAQIIATLAQGVGV